MCMQTCIEGRWALYSRHGVHVRKYNSDSSIESNNGEDDAKILEGKGEEVDEERAACCQQSNTCATACVPCADIVRKNLKCNSCFDNCRHFQKTSS